MPFKHFQSAAYVAFEPIGPTTRAALVQCKRNRKYALSWISPKEGPVAKKPDELGLMFGSEEPELCGEQKSYW